MFRLCYFPVQWKYAQIIMIAKPGNPPTEASSYRPISLLQLIQTDKPPAAHTDR
jgi:hypothetical protein